MNETNENKEPVAVGSGSNEGLGREGDETWARSAIQIAGIVLVMGGLMNIWEVVETQSVAEARGRFNAHIAETIAQKMMKTTTPNEKS